MLHHQHKNLLTANRVAFMIIGFLEASWAPLVPYVKSAFAMDEASLGMLMLCSGVGSFCALPFSGFLVNRYGLCIAGHWYAAQCLADRPDACGFWSLYYSH